jgi:hypothetical protein
MSSFRERLRVPTRWWVQWTVMVGSFWLALVVAVPERLAWSVSALLLLVMAVLLRSYGSPRIIVTEHWLHAGRARIERRYTGSVTALDAPAMRLQAGRDANARAYVLLRPYVSTGVRVEITDPRDPTPYWLLSSRRASALAAALAETEAPASQQPP